MNHIYNILTVIVVLLIVVIGCSKSDEQSTDEEKEESGTELALDETYDKTETAHASS